MSCDHNRDTLDGIAEELIQAGIPKIDIVLGVHNRHRKYNQGRLVRQTPKMT